MTSHDEQFHEHAIWTVLHDTKQAVASLPAESFDLGAERIAAVVRHLDRWLDRADPSLVPISNLENVRQHLAGILTQLQAFSSSRNAQHIFHALEQIDGVLASAQPIWSATTADDVGAVREDVAAFRESAGRHLTSLSGQVDQLRNDLHQVGAARDVLRAEIDEQRGRLDSAIAEYQMQFSQAQEARTREDEAARATRQQEFDNAMREAREGFARSIRTAEDERNTMRVTAEAQLSEARQTAEDDQAALAASGHATLQTLDELREQAARVVGVVGNIGITGDYQKSALHEKRQAFWWAVAALTFFLAAVFAAAYFLTVDTDGLGASGTARRIALSLIVGAPATFCVTQAREHRSAERRNRSLELELASLSPFIADLPEEYQQAMKADLATRYFRGNDASAESVDVESWLQRFRK